MAINPMQLMQLKSLWGRFQKNHPKFVPFLQAAADHGLVEGSVISITVKTPDGAEIASNIKLNAEDMDLMKTIKSMQK